MVLTTTIKISKKLRKELGMLKEHPRETYEDVVERLVRVSKKQEGTIVAAKNLDAGETIQASSIMLEPGTSGLSARFMQKLQGKRTLYAIKKGGPITFGLVDL